MSLLSICENVLTSTGWDSYTTISSNTDKTARQIFALCNIELRNLARRFSWPQLIRENPFDTVAGQSAYNTPEDFEKLIQDSAYNIDEYYSLRSSMTDRQWNDWRYGLLGQLSHQRYKLRYSNGVPYIQIAPTPDSAERLIYVYKSKYYVKSADGSELKEKFALDDDVSIVPEDVVEAGVCWRFRRMKGLDFSAELSEYNEMTRTRFAQSRGEGDIPIPNGNYMPEITEGYVPSNGFG